MQKNGFKHFLAIAAFWGAALLFLPAHALSQLDDNLIYQTNFGTAAEVRKALDAGANPDAISDDGSPVISLAAQRGDEEGTKIVRMLVDAGANLNVRDVNGETPLMNAITNNNPAMVKYMIEQGADFHAMSKSGRNVLNFAKHYADDEVVFYVQEAIRLEEERIRQGLSRSHLYKMLDDYVYYNCALQYLAYNRDTHLYPKSKAEEVAQKIEKVQGHIANAQSELHYNFKIKERGLQEMASSTQTMIFEELEKLISNRNRLKYGVGTDKDLHKRCTAVLDVWQDTFDEYEKQRQAEQQQR